MEHTGKTRRPGGERGWMVGLRIDEWTRQEKYFRYEIIFLCLLSIIIYTEYMEKYHEMRVLYGQKLEADQRKTEQLMSVPDHAAEARRMAPAMRPKNASSDAIAGPLLRPSSIATVLLSIITARPSNRPTVRPSINATARRSDRPTVHHRDSLTVRAIDRPSSPQPDRPNVHQCHRPTV